MGKSSGHAPSEGTANIIEAVALMLEKTPDGYVRDTSHRAELVELISDGVKQGMIEAARSSEFAKALREGQAATLKSESAVKRLAGKVDVDRAR